MSQHREILAALERLRSGALRLSPDQYVGLLDAVEQVAEALHVAPRGSDPIATALWWNHERKPALVRLVDALTPHAAAGRGVVGGPLEPSDAVVAKALHQSLLDNVSR